MIYAYHPSKDQVRNTARLRHLSLKTEKAYVNQIKRYILFHGKKHPAEMSEGHIRAYLSYLAVERNVAASTENVALAALLFLYRDVLKQKLDRIEEVERARISRHMPVVRRDKRYRQCSKISPVPLIWQAHLCMAQVCA